MVNITFAVRQIKDDLPQLLTPIAEQALREHPDDAWRDRVLNPLVTILLFVQQVMRGNTAITQCWSTTARTARTPTWRCSNAGDCTGFCACISGGSSRRVFNGLISSLRAL